MKYIKILAVLVLPFLLLSWLWSQDLTAAAKKEKERREAAKAKKVTVITNADLQAVKKKAAVAGETAEAATTEGEGGQAEGTGAEPGAMPVATPETTADTSAQEPMPIGTGGAGGGMQAEDAQKAILEGNYLKAKEYADLLETRVNGLWQTFYNMDDMTPKDQIQQQIADAFDKYTVARQDEEKAKEELDRYLASIKKD